jgi:hypothetical protein
MIYATANRFVLFGDPIRLQVENAALLPMRRGHLSRQFNCQAALWHLWIGTDASKPSVNRREDITRIGALALITPEAGDAGGGAQSKPFCFNGNVARPTLGRL